MGWGFPYSSAGKESTYNAGDLGSISGLGRSPGGGHGNPLQYSCLETPHGQRSLVGYCPCGCKESDRTEDQAEGRVVGQASVTVAILWRRRLSLGGLCDESKDVQLVPGRPGTWTRFIWLLRQSFSMAFHPHGIHTLFGLVHLCRLCRHLWFSTWLHIPVEYMLKTPVRMAGNGAQGQFPKTCSS